MLSTIAICSVKPFTKNNKTDKNGKTPVLFSVFAGSIPSRSVVISGTIAERAGIKVGETHLLKFQEVEASEYGREFRVETLGTLSALELATSDFSHLGQGTVVDVSKVDSEPTTEDSEEVVEEQDIPL